MKPGIYEDISNEDYHSGPGISKSMLDVYNNCPVDYEWFYLKRNQRTETDAMRLGTALHMAILEPEKFSETYVVAPNCRKNSKEWKAFESEHEGKIILKEDEYKQISAMGYSVGAHTYASMLLLEGKAECSAYSEDQDTGLLLRCRPDFLNKRNIVVDLKTTVNASSGAFSSSVYKYRYHVQQAFYMDVLESLGIDVDVFCFLVVEKTPPHKVAIYTLSDRAISLGRELYKKNLSDLKCCLDSNSWPGLQKSSEDWEIDLPEFAYHIEEK